MADTVLCANPYCTNHTDPNVGLCRRCEEEMVHRSDDDIKRLQWNRWRGLAATDFHRINRST